MNIFNKQNLSSGVKNVLTILISILIVSAVVKAGTITPPSGGGEPSAKFYTISEIYTRLTTNATSTEGAHDFTFSDGLAGTGRTLAEIYNAIPTIIANTVKLGTTYLGVAGTLVPSGGNAAPADVLSGKTFFGDSQADWNTQTGTMANIGAQTITPSISNQAITQGYHNGTGYCSGDGDLVAVNIASNVDIFGVSGTLLKNLYNGSAGVLVADSAFYTQAKGGVDDYNNNGTISADSYTAGWTTCDAGNSYCVTGDATNADKKDNSTNLVWSKWLDSGTAHTWFWANNCYEPGTAENPGTCASNGDDACQCVKKATSLVGCEALGGGWRLPYQKELMQVYIDGSWGNLSSTRNYYWSATTRASVTQGAWYVDLSYGYTNSPAKTAGYQVRCVR